MPGLAGRRVRLLILARALNGLILPATLVVTVLAPRRPDRLASCRYSRWLTAAGWVALVAGSALLSLGELRRLWGQA